MDTHIGDLLPSIVGESTFRRYIIPRLTFLDREIEIIHELGRKVLLCDEAMTNACDICAELDVLLSFAESSRAYEYRRPTIVDEPVIDIVQGRHPLQEQVEDTFVPNSCRLVGGAGVGSTFDGYEEEQHDGEITDWNSVALCTGANACGKVRITRGP